MSGLDSFERWAELARAEQAPQARAASAVLAHLRAPIPQPPGGLWAIALSSACAAAVGALVAYETWLAMLGDWYGWAQDLMPRSLL